MTAAALQEWAPAFALVFARIAPTMILLPGLGEQSALVTLRVALALSLTILLLPELKPLVPLIPESGFKFGLMMTGEIITGLWFGWLARQVELVLPILGQITAYLTGLASVLQPDAELGPQSTALGKLFGVVAPLLMLLTGLYKYPVLALDGLFRLLPPGTMLPATDGIRDVVAFVGLTFGLAVQLASPFIFVAIAWHAAIGVTARIVSRMQIYFVSMPGQLLAGFLTLAVTGSAIILAWQSGGETLLSKLPGSG